MSQECWCSSHFCDNRGFPFHIHRCLNKETKKTRNEYKLSLIMTFISKFYLYKCSHCLGSQASTCSCKSQELWYILHLYGSHDFHPCIHQFLERVENIKLQRKLNYLQKMKSLKACVVNYTITNAPISFVARPAHAVIWARNVGTVRIYVTLMSFILAFVQVLKKEKKTIQATNLVHRI